MSVKTTVGTKTSTSVASTPAPVDGDGPSFHMVFSPTAPNPPTKRMTAIQAEVVAKKMAGEHPGQEFYVLEARMVVVQPPATLVVKNLK
jgi:hypothetical protein